MRRLVNLPASGWYSGDLHVHMNYGGTYRTVPAQLAFMARAEDLHVIEELIVNKEQRVPDISYFGGGAPDPVSTPSMLIVHGQEFHTSYWGHSGLLGLTKNIILPGYAAYANTPAASLYPANANVFDLAHAQGALTGYVHPFDEMPNPEDTVSRVTSELPVDVALGKVDYMEILGFSDHRSTAAIWYRLLNCGFRIPAGAGTDAMTNYASLRGPVGMNRVYVHSGAKLDHASYLRAIKAGHTFATNGPLLSLAVNGKEPGNELAFPLGSHTISVRASMHSIVPVDHLELVQNGKVVATLPMSADHQSALATVKLPWTRAGGSRCAHGATTPRRRCSISIRSRPRVLSISRSPGFRRVRQTMRASSSTGSIACARARSDIRATTARRRRRRYWTSSPVRARNSRSAPTRSPCRASSGRWGGGDVALALAASRTAIGNVRCISRRHDRARALGTTLAAFQHVHDYGTGAVTRASAFIRGLLLKHARHDCLVLDRVSQRVRCQCATSVRRARVSVAE